MASDVSEAVKAEVARRAGRHCEYCLIHEEDAGFAHQVDHILSLKHGGASTIDNLAYACVICNRNKGSDVAAIDPGSGEAVRLFHPRRDRWADHFSLEGELIHSRTVVGEVTVRVLRLNAPERLSERRLLQFLGRYPVR